MSSRIHPPLLDEVVKPTSAYERQEQVNDIKKGVVGSYLKKMLMLSKNENSIVGYMRCYAALVVYLFVYKILDNVNNMPRIPFPWKCKTHK